MKHSSACLLLLALTGMSGFAANSSTVPSGAVPAVPPGLETGTVTLPQGGPFQLRLGLAGMNGFRLPLNGFTLGACGTNLLDPRLPEIVSGVSDPGLPSLTDVRVDGTGPDRAFANSLSVVGRLSSNEWECVVVDATAAYGKRLTLFRRHLLFVQPDLFVIYDDLIAAAPVKIEYSLRSPGELQLDDRSGDLRVETPAAGLTAHWLCSDNHAFTLWRTATHSSGLPKAARTGGAVHTVSTNLLTRVRALTAIIPHCAGQRQGTGFKLLESDTAIGARIYRNGLPTLVAFRTVETGEANLIGLKFTAPLAVDVFRPRPRRR